MRDQTLLDRFGVKASPFSDDGPVAVLEPGSDCEDEFSSFGESNFGDVGSSNPFGVEPPGVEPPGVQVGENTFTDDACQSKISLPKESPNAPLDLATAPPKDPPAFKPPREVVRLVVGLIGKSMRRIGASWHLLEPDEAFHERIDESAKEALRPPYTKPKIEAFKQLLGEWEAFELDRVKRWIEAARERTDGWDAVRCGLCEFRIGELTAGGVGAEKAIQIAFSELSGE